MGSVIDYGALECELAELDVQLKLAQARKHLQDKHNQASHGRGTRGKTREKGEDGKTRYVSRGGRPDKTNFKEANPEAMAKHYDKALKDGCNAGKISCGALTEYTGSDYATINDALRKGSLSDPYTAAQVKLLDLSINNAPRVPGDIVTQRYAGGKGIFKIMQSLKPGDSFQDQGFMSTTIAKDAKLDDIPGAGKGQTVAYKINVPKGSKAAYIPSVSEFPDEKELLLPRGSKFRLDSKQVKDGVLEIEMTLQE